MSKKKEKLTPDDEFTGNVQADEIVADKIELKFQVGDLVNLRGTKYHYFITAWDGENYHLSNQRNGQAIIKVSPDQVAEQITYKKEKETLNVNIQTERPTEDEPSEENVCDGESCEVGL